MQVLGDPGSGSRTLVDAKVEALGTHAFLDDTLRLLNQPHHLTDLLRGEGTQCVGVSIGDNHQVSVVIRVEIQNDEAMLAAMQDVRGPVVRSGPMCAEHTRRISIGGPPVTRDVGHPPGRPHDVLPVTQSHFFRRKYHTIRPVMAPISASTHTRDQIPWCARARPSMFIP